MFNRVHILAALLAQAFSASRFHPVSWNIPKPRSVKCSNRHSGKYTGVTNGKREVSRRLRQIAAGKLQVSQ